MEGFCFFWGTNLCVWYLSVCCGVVVFLWGFVVFLFCIFFLKRQQIRASGFNTRKEALET